MPRLPSGLLFWFLTLVAFDFLTAPLSAAPPIRSPQTFKVTAYCQQGVTKSGFPTQPGAAAADLGYLPMGSIVQVQHPTEVGQPPPNEAPGVYTVLDTGAKVNGRHLDLFVADCNRAKQFGRRLLEVMILRFGWHSHVPAPRPF